MRFAALILILFVGTANAETFKCQAGTYWSSGDKVVVIATINEDGVTGTIKVAGTSYDAKYQVNGFDRRWDFDLADDFTYNYAFLMKASGNATYYDFSDSEFGETVQGSQSFFCR